MFPLSLPSIRQGVNLEAVDLSNLDLRNINFKCANLRHCNFAQCDLSDCVFERADMCAATLDVCTPQYRSRARVGPKGNMYLYMNIGKHGCTCTYIYMLCIHVRVHVLICMYCSVPSKHSSLCKHPTPFLMIPCTVFSPVSAHGRLKLTGQKTRVGACTDKPFVCITHAYIIREP